MEVRDTDSDKYSPRAESAVYRLNETLVQMGAAPLTGAQRVAVAQHFDREMVEAAKDSLVILSHLDSFTKWARSPINRDRFFATCVGCELRWQFIDWDCAAHKERCFVPPKPQDPSAWSAEY